VLLRQWNTLYYTVMVLVFTWVNVPLGGFWLFREIPWRMAAGALFCVLILSPVFLFMINHSQLRFLVVRQLEGLSFFQRNASFSTPEELLYRMVHIVLRGGILFSSMLFWWINRQVGLLATRLFLRDNTFRAGQILSFRVPSFLVWVLSFSLGAVLLGITGKIELLEIAGWNMLVLSATLFLVQGGAVALFFLTRIPPLPRIIITVGLVFLLFRPGLYMAILGLLVLLGITENWASFRTPRQE
jgi:hypothetical protein